MFNLTNIPTILILSTLALGGFGTFSYMKGHSAGSEKIQKQWEFERNLLDSMVRKKELEIAQKELAHRDELNKLESQYAEALIEYEQAISTIHADYSDRLRESEGRASTYRNWAEAGSTESQRLADHAAKLDQALTEGRSLVDELRRTVKQREREIGLLGQQLVSDRNLIGVRE